MQWVMAAMLVMMATWAQAEPKLSTAQAEQLVEQSFRFQPLYWNPFPLPYVVAQQDQGKDAVLLDALFRHGLLTREAITVQTQTAKARPQYERRWQYNYPTTRSAQLPEGFYYGKPKLLHVISLTAAMAVNGEFFAHGRVEWMVEDLQPWAEDAAFRSARTLRRSQQSAHEPFEMNTVFKYDVKQQAWELWQPPEF